MLTTNKCLGLCLSVRSACKHLESTLLFPDTNEVHPVPKNVDLISPQFPFLSRRSAASQIPTVFSPLQGHPSLLQALPPQVLARIPCCDSYRSCALPLRRPQHRYLHRHVKAKFLNLSARGCRPPKASSPDAGLLYHAAVVKPPQHAVPRFSTSGETQP